MLAGVTFLETKETTVNAIRWENISLVSYRNLGNISHRIGLALAWETLFILLGISKDQASAGVM